MPHGYARSQHGQGRMIGLIDIIGAAMFAAGLARAVGGWGTAALWPSLALLVAGGVVRAAGMVALHAHSIRRAQTRVRHERAMAWPALLGGARAQPILPGTSATLAIDHMTAIEAFESQFSPARAMAGAGPLLVIALVAVASPVCAAILAGTLIPMVFGMILAGTAARRASDAQLAALGRLSGLFADRVRALPLIRHYHAQDRIGRHLRAATRDVADRTVAVLRMAFLSSAVLEFFAALGLALVAVYCGFALLHELPFRSPETLTLPQAFFALAMAVECYLPMRRLAAAYHEKQLGEAAKAALDEAVAATFAPPTATGAFAGLSVRDLAVSWPGTQIGPVSFDLARHDFIALTGATGSGKTSLLAAIAGQIAHTGTVTPHSPDDTAWAAQTPLLLPGTLGENIALARPSATPAEIEAAALRVGLGPVMAARGRLGLHLDHRGAGLSGGERRRIGLARAVLSNLPLLLCDEPTADLDPESAAEIIALLADLAQERAVLVATHDPLLVAAARLEIAL